jgi:hypothetical protein
MSGVRVSLHGPAPAKGAFILTSTSTPARQEWEVSGPHFAGWEIYHLKGSPAESQPDLRVAVHRLVRPVDPALRRRRPDVGAGRQRVRLRGRPGHATVVRRHASIRGSSSASGCWSRRPPTRTRSTPAWRMPRSFRSTDGGKTWQELARAARRERPALAAGRGRDVSAHHPARPEQPRTHLRRDLGGGRLPQRRRRRDLAPINRGCTPTGNCLTPMRRSATACTASPCTRPGPKCSSCRSTGT